MTKIKRVQIYGERCSGTNYLKKLIETNFEEPVVNNVGYGHKHFFGFQDLKNSKDVLFICIIRDPFTWLNSFYKKPWHVDPKITRSIDSFLGEEFSSYYDASHGPERNGLQITEDTNIFYPKTNYKNIFELRYTKVKWMLEVLPRKVEHCLFVRYEDFINSFTNTMYLLKNKGLTVKDINVFPKNYYKYKDSNKEYTPVDKEVILSKNIVLNHTEFSPLFEKRLGYM
jgi:hypothetical protein